MKMKDKLYFISYLIQHIIRVNTLQLVAMFFMFVLPIGFCYASYSIISYAFVSESILGKLFAVQIGLFLGISTPLLIKTFFETLRNMTTTFISAIVNYCNGEIYVKLNDGRVLPPRDEIDKMKQSGFILKAFTEAGRIVNGEYRKVNTYSKSFKENLRIAYELLTE